MAYARRTPLKMLPTLAAFARQRANALGITLSTYLGILLWNYSQAPRKMKPEPAAAAFARVHLPCSVRPQVWGVTRDHVATSGLNANSLIEALVAEDREGPVAGIWIRART